jgi:hypothetical protein
MLSFVVFYRGRESPVRESVVSNGAYIIHWKIRYQAARGKE